MRDGPEGSYSKRQKGSRRNSFCSSYSCYQITLTWQVTVISLLLYTLYHTLLFIPVLCLLLNWFRFLYCQVWLIRVDKWSFVKWQYQLFIIRWNFPFYLTAYQIFIFMLEGNVFCANRFRVPAVTLFFDILSFPFMVRRENNVLAGIVDSLPVNTTALKVEYDIRNAQKIERAMVSRIIVPAVFNPKVISKSYVNIKKYCDPWPKCVSTNLLT